MVTPSGERFFDTLKSKLDQFAAIEDKREECQREVEVIPPKRKNITYDT
jgi:hypothetical protein